MFQRLLIQWSTRARNVLKILGMYINRCIDEFREGFYLKFRGKTVVEIHLLKTRKF